MTILKCSHKDANMKKFKDPWKVIQILGFQEIWLKKLTKIKPKKKTNITEAKIQT